MKLIIKLGISLLLTELCSANLWTVDNAGIVGVSDLLIVIAAWGDCP